MALMRFHMRSHRLVLSKDSWAAAAKAARAAIPVLIAKGLHHHAAQLASRVTEFERWAAGEINEIHRGAMQPKGCAEVVWTEPSMSGSVVASGDAVRDASAMPLDVAAAPHSEGREHVGSAISAPPACSWAPA